MLPVFFDVDVDVESAVGGFVDFQAGVFKSGVAQAVSESEERVDFFPYRTSGSPH